MVVRLVAALGIVRTDPGAIKCPELGCGADLIAVVELKATPLDAADTEDGTAYIGIESNIIALEGCEHAAAWEPE